MALTWDEIDRRDERMKQNHCYLQCLSCEGCIRFTSNQQKCINCAPEYRRCQCAHGKRVGLLSDGFIAIKDFGAANPNGDRLDRGKLVRIRQVVMSRRPE